MMRNARDGQFPCIQRKYWTASFHYGYSGVVITRRKRSNILSISGWKDDAQMGEPVCGPDGKAWTITVEEFCKKLQIPLKKSKRRRKTK